MIDWGRQKPKSICHLLHEVFHMELEKFLRQLEEDGLSPNTTDGYKRIVTYFLLFCQENSYESLSGLKTNDVSRFIASLYHDGRYRPTTIGSARKLDQHDYRKKYDGYASRYAALESRMDSLEKERERKEIQYDLFSGFFAGLSERHW